MDPFNSAVLNCALGDLTMQANGAFVFWFPRQHLDPKIALAMPSGGRSRSTSFPQQTRQALKTLLEAEQLVPSRLVRSFRRFA
jgi:hypothetical protein